MRQHRCKDAATRVSIALALDLYTVDPEIFAVEIFSLLLPNGEN